MNKLKFISIILFAVFISTSCSFIDKLKEKFSSKKDDKTKEQTIDNKEKTTENTSGDDLNFYNKYIDVSNKISEVVDGVHKGYTENIPEPKNIKKGMFLMTIAYDFKVGELERLIKDQKRSFFDGGELSKLKANDDMKKDIESSYRALLDELDKYYDISKKVMDYYKDKEYESNPSKASDLDTQMKDEHGRYKDTYEKFNGMVKKYKPKRNERDVSSISDPNQKSMAVLMNAYENTLDNAESFFGKFQKIEKGGDVSSLQGDINDFEKSFDSEKKTVQSTEFTDVTKSLKYSFEDYFSKTVADFTTEAKKFLDKAPTLKGNEFNKGYDEVVTKYNYMINAYNTSIQTLNLMNQFKY